SNGAAIANGVEMVAKAAARVMAQIRLPIMAVLLSGYSSNQFTFRSFYSSSRLGAYRNRMGATSLAAPAGARPLEHVGYCRAASLSPQPLCFVFVSFLSWRP